MADPVLSALVQEVMGKLTSLVAEELRIVWGLKSDLRAMESVFSTIQAVLQDQESKQRKSKAQQDWLTKLKSLSLELENVLDEIATEVSRRRSATGKTIKNPVRIFSVHHNPLVFRVKMAHKVRDIRKKLNAIAAEKSNFHLTDHDGDGDVESVDRVTSSFVNEGEILGRNDEKDMIVSMICGDLGDHDGVEGIPAFAVCGMGGIGKTTLAQLVYNDKRVKERFEELRIWLCVSYDFDIVRLSRAIVESIEGSPCNISELDKIQKRLQERLSGRRFLLVLDDVWNEYQAKWDRLRVALGCGQKGSVVMVTTRSEKIARMMATCRRFVHQINCLPEDESWSLFKGRAFGREMSEESISELESTGKEIVKKCGGLPLAVKALGSMMRLKSNTDEWLSVKESKIWDLQDDGSAILPALRLSYNNLPTHVRRCFAYCCLFPKGWPMQKNVLLELWMANNFVSSSNENSDLNVVGEEIFKDLVWRSFLQDVSQDFEGEVTCKMHDLMHDLALSVMKNEYLLIPFGKVLEVPKEILHLSSEHVPSSNDMSKVQSLRSFIIHGQNIYVRRDIPCHIFEQRYLRVLHLTNIRGQRLPESVGDLIHLRFLDCSNSELEVLPESISRLHNLEVFKLRRCVNLLKLPDGMGSMRNLRHLDIRGCVLLVSMPIGMGKLTCLKKLTTFIVGQKRGQQIGELGELNRLGGELSIKGLDNVRHSRDAYSANLRSKENITSLSLLWHESTESNLLCDNVEEVLKGLQPNSNLKKLEISGYQGLQFPNWIVNLVNLVDLTIANCGRCETLPPLGNLPFLGGLRLEDMESVKVFNEGCYKAGSFPCLHYLYIEGCPGLTSLPKFPRVNTLILSGVDEMLVRSVMKLTTLTDLKIKYIYGLKAFPKGMFDDLTALKKFSLLDLNSLEGLPEEYNSLTSLETLLVSGCRKLKSVHADWFQGLSNLRSMTFEWCSALEYFSGGLQHLTALEALAIMYCPSVRSLPDGLQDLSMLKTLSIFPCLYLKNRCKAENGEDWPKIAHVPKTGITIW